MADRLQELADLIQQSQNPNTVRNTGIYAFDNPPPRRPNILDRLTEASERNTAKMLPDYRGSTVGLQTPDLNQMTKINPYTLGDFGRDVAGTALNAAITVPEALVGAVDLGDAALSGTHQLIQSGLAKVGLADEPNYEVETGRFGRWIEENTPIQFKEAKDFVNNEIKSDNTREVNQRFAEMEGLDFDQGVAYNAQRLTDMAKYIAANPGMAVQAAAESLPAMFLGGAAARGGTALGQAISRGAAQRAAQVGTAEAAIGEGMVMAAIGQEGLRQEKEGGRTNITDTALMTGVGAVGAGVAGLGGRIAQRAGIEDVDTVIARGGLTTDPVENAKRNLYQSLMTNTKVAGGTALEAAEEAVQGTAETVTQNMQLDKPLEEQLGQNITLGAAAGGVMGAVPNAARVAKDTTKAATSTTKAAATKVKDKVLTPTFEELTNPDSRHYDPAKAVQSQLGGLASDDEASRETARKNIESVRQRSEADIEAADASLKLVQEELDVLAGDEGNPEIQPYIDDANKRKTKFEADRKAAREVLLNIEQVLADHDQNLASAQGEQVDVDTLASKEVTPDSVVEEVLIHHQQMNAEDIEAIRKANSGVLTDVQNTALKEMSAARRAQADLNSMAEVNKEVMTGRKATKSVPATRGLLQYEQLINRAIKNQDQQLADSVLDDLADFARDHEAKASTVETAYKNAKSKEGIQVVKTAEGTWKMITDPTQFLSESDLKKAHGVRVHPGSQRLVTAIRAEADAITKTNNALDALAVASIGQKPAETPAAPKSRALVPQIKEDVVQIANAQNALVSMRKAYKSGKGNAAAKKPTKPTGNQNTEAVTPTPAPTPSPVAATAQPAININAGQGENAHLSNFAKRKFSVNGQKFYSVEQAFHFAKAKAVDRDDIAQQVLKTFKGGELRKLTNAQNMKLDKEQRAKWDGMSESVMHKLMKASFEQDATARQALLDTGDVVLTHQYNGKEMDNGRFSRVLTKIRDEIRNAPETTESIDQVRAQVVAYMQQNGNASAAKHLPKELDKVEQATQFIGEGKPGSSTDIYRAAWDEQGLANTGNYTADDVIMLAANGKRNGGFVPVKDGKLQGQYALIDKAIEAGASFLADTEDHLNKSRNYNTGEIALADYLASKGYTRTTVNGAGFWTKLQQQEENNESTADAQAAGQETETETPDGSQENPVPVLKPSEDAKLSSLRKVPREEILAEQSKPYNERNLLKAHFKQKSDPTRPLTSITNFLDELRKDIKGIAQQFLPEKYKISNRQVAQLQHYLQFHDKFRKQVLDIVRIKKEDYRYQDLFQFAIEQDDNGGYHIPENVIVALSLSAYSWLIENGGVKYNDEEAVAGLLHLPDDTRIPWEVMSQYRDVGNQRVLVINSLGSKAVSNLGISARTDSDSKYESRLEASFGNLVYATMLNLDLVDEIEFSQEIHSQNLDLVKQMNQDFGYNSELNANVHDQASQYTSYFYVRAARNDMGEPNAEIQKLLDTSKETKGIMTQLFGSTVGLTMPSFEAPAKYTQQRIKGSKSVPASVQAEHITASQKRGFTVRSGVAKVMRDLFNTDRDFLYGLMGILADEKILAREHIHSREAKRDAMVNEQRNLENVMEFLSLAENVDGSYKEFWDTQHISGNMRMYYDSRGFNAQSHQSHRVLAGLTDFRSEINLNEDVLDENGQPTSLGLLLLAIAENFEGLENSKIFEDRLGHYMLRTADKVHPVDFLPVFVEYLGQDVISKGVAAVRILLEGGKLSRQQKVDLINAVKEGDMGVQSLYALVELTQLMDAMARGDSTHITYAGIGSDGINNGVAIANIQAGTASYTMRKQIGFIPAAEARTTKNYYDTRRDGELDYYQEFAAEFKKDWEEFYKQANAAGKRLYDAMGTLFKSFGKRKVAKDWTIPFNYNAGFPALKRALANRFLEDIYDQMNNIAQKARAAQHDKKSLEYRAALEARDELQQNLNIIGVFEKLPAPEMLSEWDFGMQEDGEIDYATHYKILKDIMRIHSQTYGAVGERTTKRMAGEYIEQRNINVALQKAAFEVYQYVRERVVDKYISELEDRGRIKKVRLAGSEGVETYYDGLTPEDEAAIDRIMLAYAPIIRTSMSAKSKNPLESGIHLTSYKPRIIKEAGDVVQSSFNRGRIPGKAKTYNLETGLRTYEEEAIGIAGLSGSVQSVDAGVSAETQGTTPSINAHDNNITGIGTYKEVGGVQNHAFIEQTAFHHSQVENLNALLSTLEGLRDLGKEYGITEGEIDLLLDSTMGKTGARKVAERKLKTALGEATSIPGIKGVEDAGFWDVMEMLVHTQFRAEQRKLDIYLNTYAVQQYAAVGSEVVIDTAMRQRFHEEKARLQQLQAEYVQRLGQLQQDILKGVRTGEGNKNVTADVVEKSGHLTPFQQWFAGRTGQTLPISELIQLVKKHSKGVQRAVMAAVEKLLPEDLEIVYFDLNNPPEYFQNLDAKKQYQIKGWYDAESNKMYIKPLSAPGSRVEPALVLHELIHAAFAQRLNQSDRQSDAYKALNALRKEFQEKFPDWAYMAKNMDEFLAYVMSEPEVQKLMNNTMTDRNGRTKDTGIKSMFTQFLNYLVNLLGWNFRGKQIPMLQAFIHDTTILMAELSTIEPVQFQRTFHSMSTEEKVAELPTSQIFSLLPAGNNSAEFEQHLSGLLEEVNSLYRESPVTAEQINKIEVHFSPAVRAGFALSDRENYMVQALKAVMDTYQETQAGTNVISQIRKIYERAAKNLTVEQFHDGNWLTATAAERKMAQRRYNYLFKPNNPNGKSDHLSRFMAMALGSEKVNGMLQQVLPLERRQEKSWFDKLMAVVDYVVNFLGNKFAGIRANDTAATQLRILSSKLKQLDLQARRSTVPLLDRMWSRIGVFTQPLNNLSSNVIANALNRDFLKRSNFRLLRVAGKTAQILSSEEVSKMPAAMKEIRDRQHPNSRLGALAELGQEILAPSTLRKLMDKLVRHANRNAADRKSMIDNTKKAVLGMFSDNGAGLSKEQHKAVTYTLLRNDLQSLLDKYNETDIFNFIRSRKFRMEEIHNLEDSIVNQYHDLGNDMVIRAKILARYMVDGVAVEGLAKNAAAIAAGVETDYLKPSRADTKLTRRLDHLVSLYALEYSKDEHRKTVAELIKDERNAMEGLLKLHHAMVKEAMTDFTGNRFSYNKGYLPDITHPNREISYAESEKERQQMEKEGWVYVSTLSRDRNDKTSERYMMIHRDIGYQRYVSGAVDLLNTARKGTTVMDRSTVGREFIDATKDRVNAAKTRRKYSHKNFNPFAQEAGMVASFDSEGQVTAYAYEMNNNLRDEQLERNNNFADLLGQLQGQLVYRPLNENQHKAVLSVIYDDSKRNYAKHPSSYVRISPKDPDPKVREMWAMLPHDFREEAAKLYGQGKPILINNEIYNMTFGFKKYSLVNAFGKDADERNLIERLVVMLMKVAFQDKAIAATAKAGHIWAEIIRFIKDAIVIRGVEVLVGNIFSNILVLALNNVHPVQAAKDAVYAIRHARSYQTTRDRILQLQSQRKGGQGDADIDNEIARLQDVLHRNPLKDFIEAGMLSTIVEDVMIQESDYTYMSEFQKKVDQHTKWIPKPLKEMGKWAMVSPDTHPYQLLSTATQYSDFTAKYSLYKALMKQGKSHEEALAEASQVFINYDTPTSRELQYANDIGLFMFTKFFLRFQSTMYRLLEKKAASTLGQHMLIETFTDQAGVLDPFMLNRLGNNPFESSIFGLPEAVGEIFTIDMVL